MNIRSYISYTIYLFAFIGFISIFEYAYKNRTEFLPIFIKGKYQNFLNETINLTKNILLNHIEKCPECILFLLEKESIYNILNNIPIKSETIFYPLTMKLF